MKIKLLTLLLIFCGIHSVYAMDTPPPHCVTDQAKAEYAALCEVLLSANTQRISEHVKKYNIDLNSRCMNIWTKRVHHPTYPIEWIIQKTYSHECIEALLKLGVQAQGYNDYSPLVDLVVRDMNSTECMRVLYMYGADPNIAGLGRDKVSRIPLAHIRECRGKIPQNSMYKADATKLKHFNEIETLLSSARPALPQQQTVPQGIPVQAGGPQLSNTNNANTSKPLLTATRCVLLGLVLCGIAYAVYKKYSATDDKDDEQEANQNTVQNDEMNRGHDEAG